MSNENAMQIDPPKESAPATTEASSKNDMESAELQKKIDELCELGRKPGQLSTALDGLLSIEKVHRLSGDLAKTRQIVVAIVQLCYDCKEWSILNDQLVLVSKRRAQLKQAIARMVQEAMTLLEKTPDKETKLKLLETLRTITAGKMFVEVERARLTKMLSKIREDEGNLHDASKILQEAQVETFGAMERKEKIEFILDQIRLCLACEDYIRAPILCNKISTTALNQADFQELKLRFYRLRIQIHKHTGSFLEISKAYQAILATPSVQTSEELWKDELKRAVVYLLLAPHNNEQHDMLHRIFTMEKKLDDLPNYKNPLKYFTTVELIRWPKFEEIYSPELKDLQDVFGGADGEKRWKEFQRRVVEHNLRVMSKYYRRINSVRLAELLDLSQDDAEARLCDMVSDKTIYAKIDRTAGVVQFEKTKDPNDRLNDWSDKISKLLSLVESTTYMISREEMIHQTKH
eukprot:TRINITY_DN19732_c0_g1::TRINITY_DN19732_c0_g1_i1::g.3270::m.3270 TRINITY_DN19732_c0_g1::TRINITY_DN19732_c0_g1_i1::g.3270  ORF type:complete len:462 (-),score=123.44,sp/Q2KJ25/PSD12_BOVIN/50.57/3e-155,PCI/PF01399.22/8.2e-18,ERp29/PF07749.7/0.24,ERp29/PF07749.7/5.7e+02,ATG16/PF08614.6/2.1e+02,ATG16/PF08614.6/4.3e+02,ATG16/PF08614.6/2.6 TRINITY_DN19732_c0_g1_i1:534-1919(-)